MLQRKMPLSAMPAQAAGLTGRPGALGPGFTIPASLAFLVQNTGGVSLRATGAGKGSRWVRALLPHFLSDRRLRVHLEHALAVKLAAPGLEHPPETILACAIGQAKTLHLVGRVEAEAPADVAQGLAQPPGFTPVSISLSSWHVTDHAARSPR